MATQAEYQAGMAALQNYIDQMLSSQGKSWEEGFIPSSVFSTGSMDAINAADAASDQTSMGRLTAASAALRAAVNSTGEGSQVSDADCNAAAAMILDAVAALRTTPTTTTT